MKYILLTINLVIFTSLGLLHYTESSAANIPIDESKANYAGDNTKSITYKSKIDYGGDRIEKLDFLDQLSLDKGLAEISKHKVIFAGITRDNGRDTEKMMRFITKFGSFFQDYRVVIFEDDSSDDTLNILKKFESQDKKIRILSENFGIRKRPSIEFLSDIRNKYIDAINGDEYKKFDIAIILDLDMKYGFDERGILHSFSKINEWDILCSNGIYTKKGNMWDAFAFRDSEFPNGLDKLKPEEYWGVIVPKIQKIYGPQSALLPVNSCFGGLTIYKIDSIKSCRYKSINGDCEHVALHKCAREENNARIFMNPAQIIKYEHFNNRK